jgi:hypothetical protein
VNPALLALAVAVTLAAVLAVSARDARLATVGLVAALAAGPLVAEPLPDPAAVAARIVAAALAGYLVRIALRRSTLTHGTRIGWPGEVLLAGAAFGAGLAAVAGDPVVLGAPTSALRAAIGPEPAVAAGFALIATAMAPLADVRDGYRLGAGLALLVTGADLLRTGLAGTDSGLEALVVAGLIAAIGASAAVAILRGTPLPDDVARR